jgi:hypothetical protein
VPYTDDPQPNFAYFVYDGVPAWTGAAQPGVTPAVVFDTNVMQSLPVYHLISKRDSVEHCTWIDQYSGSEYKWSGTLVYDGTVYDHIHYRTRGGVWRYAMGKNMWKFDFNRGHDFQAYDNFGKPYLTPWNKLNLGACIQQGDYDHRGEQGMFEAVGFKLFNLVGVQAANTHWIQFRIIDDTAEANAANQFDGDFGGLYLAIEQMNGRFLDEHGLPDGNLYKMEGGTGTLNNQSPTGATNKSDLNQFMAAYTPNPPDAWWQTNLDLTHYYGYQTIIQGIHHYDIAAGKNYFYYLNPETGIWSVFPWDLDLTWADNMYGSGEGNEPFKSRVLSTQHPAFLIEGGNRAREVRDLLFNTDQAYQLIDEYAAIIHDPAGGWSMTDADRAMWDYNPIMVSPYINPSKAGQGRFYQFPREPQVEKSFHGTVQLMKDYVVYRSAYIDSMIADPSIPATPDISFIGATNFPVNALVFQTSSFPANGGSVTAIKWRCAEVTPANPPPFDPVNPRKYEIIADWESAELTSLTDPIQIPPSVVKVGHVYRVRARMKDSSGRWGHWSSPIEFTAGEPDTASDLRAYLRVSELMFNPVGGSDFEFIELRNSSSTQTLDLTGIKFTQGIDFTFALGTRILPGGYLLLVKSSPAENFAVFHAHYGLGSDIPIVGPYTGSLANEGERITLKTAAAGEILIEFTYGDGRSWPMAADGLGHSLVPVAAAQTNRQDLGSLDYPGNWRPSAFIGGSPGALDPEPAPSVWLNEIMANTDYADPAQPEYDSNDWIELFNPTTTNIDFGLAWYLSDDRNDLKKWPLPAISVAAKGWLSLDEVTGFHHPITSGFGLNKAGEELLLSYLPGTSEDRVVDAVSFKGQENGVSWGRIPDGGAYWQANSPTRDTTNQPYSEGIVISELRYWGGSNPEDEFIEIYNASTHRIDLFNSTGVWRLDGGVQFVFPTNTSLGAKECLVLVNFDQTNTAAWSLFRTAYELPELSTNILGPYQGKLSDTSDRVAIEKPQAPDVPGGPMAWVIVDEVIYSNHSPWPTWPAGASRSLQRVAFSRPGNDPASWHDAQPNPGKVDTDDLNPDRDQDGMLDAWELAHGLNPADPVDANQDADGDGKTNLQEYWDATDPRDPDSYYDPPVIVETPHNATIAAGDSASFEVKVSGRQPLSLQWLFNSSPLPGKTNELLQLDLVSLDQAGNYSVIVSNISGSVTSLTAQLLVSIPPGITIQPESLTLFLGESATLSVQANGSEPLTFQWRWKGTNLPGANNTQLNFRNVKSTQAGNYDVVISNQVKAATSQVAVLTVDLSHPPPSPWLHRDIGNAEIPGQAQFRNGVFTVESGGTGIGTAPDGFHFVFQGLDGDGQVTAHVLMLENTQRGAKAGIMFREDLSSGSRYAMLAVTPDAGTAFQSRLDPEGNSQITTPGDGLTAPCWLRLQRSANTLTAFTSADGTHWVQVGSAEIPFPRTVQLGLCLAAQDPSAVIQATFDQVEVKQVAALEQARLSILGLTSSGMLQLRVQGAIGGRYVLESSSNLVNWSALATNEILAGSVDYLDLSMTNQPQRFYRTWQEP